MLLYVSWLVTRERREMNDRMVGFMVSLFGFGYGVNIGD